MRNNSITLPKLFAFCATAMAVLISSSVAKAQTGGSSSQVSGSLEEIVVTARKREESIQDVPLSVSAIMSETIDRAGVENLEDIASLTAGLTFQSFNGGGLGSPTIRGLAQTDVASVDNNVGVFVDGVFINNKAGLSLNLLDIERVEVVKGPQSALYGNNAFGGAINYVTRRATDETSGQLSATIGSDELYEVAGSVSGSLIDSVLTGRISVSTSGFDGTIDNTLGENLGGFDEKSNIVLQAEYTPSENVFARFFYYHSEAEYDASAGFIFENNCGGALGSPSGLTGRGQTEQRYACGDLPIPDQVTVSPDAFGNDSSTDLYYLNLEFDFSSLTLTSLTSFSDAESAAFSDQKLNVSDDLVAPDARRFSSPFFGTTETISQEFRLDSFEGDRVGWSIGAYYIDWESNRRFEVGTLEVPTAILNLGDIVESQALSFFGQLDYEFSDSWNGSVEARYTSDDREAVLSNFNSDTTNRFDETFDFTTYRASLNYDLSDDSNLYGSIARGAKTGGFNNTPVPTEQSFDSEFNTTLELGFKSTFNDNFSLNAAIYFADWSDVQLTNPSSVAGNPNVTQNVGDVTSSGIELDMFWQATEQFSMAAGYAFSDPEFDSGTVDFTQGRRCGTPADCGLEAGPNGGLNVAGQTVDRVSKHQLYVSPQYSWSSGNRDYYVRADASYQSEQFQRSLNLQKIDARTLMNARFGVTTASGLEFAVWAKNLTDEKYLTSAINEPEFLFDLAIFSLFQSTFTTGFVGNGRQFGVSVDYRF